MLRRTRHRLQIAVLAILCLLFQQMAVAAYLCPAEQAVVDTAMPADCAAMAMDFPEPAPDNPALCQQHCSPDHSVAADAVKLTVPPLALPAQAVGTIQVQSARDVAVRADVPITRSDPPPRLRFCSLLI